jgi:ABC-2 type transport system permease protein
VSGAVTRAGLVARREFLENVRTKGFWLSLGTVPLVLLLSLALPLLSEATRPVIDFAVTDRSGWVLERLVERADAADLERLLARPATPADPEALRTLRERLAETGEAPEAVAARLTGAPADEAERALAEWWTSAPPDAVARVAPRAWRARFDLVHGPARWTPPAEAFANLAAGRIGAWLEIPEDPVGRPGAPPDPVRYHSENLTNDDLRDWIDGRLDAVVRDQRRSEAGIDGADWEWIAAGVEIDLRTADAGGERTATTGDVLAQWAPVAFVYILWISIVVVTQMLMTSTIEEKSSRLVEVLLAALRPVDLMAGKLLGIGATGLAIVGTWLATFVFAALALPALLGAEGALDLGGLATNPVYLGSFVVYFLLGYFFYAAILAGIGSVCESLKEAQTLLIPVQGILFVPLLAMIPIARDPDGPVAAVLTWLPPFTPFAMMNRAAQPPDAWVYVGTTVLMLGSIALALHGAARVFRVGILMTGQPPSLLRLLRWMVRGGPPPATRDDAAEPAP